MNPAELSTEIQPEQENMLSVNEDSKSESVEVAAKGLTKLTIWCLSRTTSKVHI